jgi:hypothetical protein
MSQFVSMRCLQSLAISDTRHANELGVLF